MYFLSIGTLFVTCIMSISATDQLSFSGGGAFGAVEIGILKKIRENYHVNYDRYTGISAGGLNSGFLSHFADIDEGIKEAEGMYSTIRNKDIYEILPDTGVSLLNTKPLHKTLTSIITNLKSNPIIDTLIGTVNLNTGNLDTYNVPNLRTCCRPREQREQRRLCILYAAPSVLHISRPYYAQLCKLGRMV